MSHASPLHTHTFARSVPAHAHSRASSLHTRTRTRTHAHARTCRYIFGDADIEAASSGRGIDRGHMRVAMDPSMGWSQMCESYEIAALNPHFW